MKHFDKKTRKFIVSALVFLVGCATAYAQGFIEAIRDNSPVDFMQHSIAKFNEGIYPGEYVIAGTVAPGPVSGNSDILVMRADDAGNIIWSKYLDYGLGEMDEFAGSVKVVDGSAQNIVLTGYTGQNNTADKQLIVIKLDANGNLLGDIRIRDTNLNYGLYGFDIAQIRSGDYIVAGTGVQAATQSSAKYAFAMRVDNALNNIQWAKIYRSNLGMGTGPTNYDSFNHILRVPNHPAYGEVFLLTGSGANTAGEQTVTNSLIDAAGTDQWGIGSIGHYINQDGYPNSGVMALYNENTNRFYIAHPAIEMVTGIMVLNGSSGGTTTQPSHGYHNHTTIGHFNNFVNGMVWASPAKDRIVFSGYHFIPNTDLGQAMLFEIDVSGPSFTNTWSRVYNEFFDANQFMGVPMDFIVRPVNRTNGFGFDAIYYQPKALVRENVDFGHRFVEPRQFSSDERFGTSFFLTNSDGELDDRGCYDSSTEDPNTEDINSSNFGSTPFSFSVVGTGVLVSNAELSVDFVCGQPGRERPFMGMEENATGMNIQIYPNPAKDYLTVAGLPGTGHLSLSLYDLQGRTVITQALPEGSPNSRVDVSGLPDGVYFLQVNEAGKVLYTQRVVKR